MVIKRKSSERCIRKTFKRIERSRWKL